MTIRRIVLGALSLLISTQMAFAATHAQRPDHPEKGQAPRSKPQITLPEKSHGQQALQRLKDSGKLPQFAAFYGLTEKEVEQLFKKDNTAYLDKTGSLHYIEPPSNTGTITTQADSGPSVAAYPLDQTFLLESKPNSPRTIYLNFVGATTTGTAWNSSYGISQINSPAFDLDGNPGSFNTTELTMIQNIWRRVAEDYSPFDVNVTTKAVDPSLITRTDSSDGQFGITVVVTKDFTGPANQPCSCGGFAYVGVFDSVGDNYKPAFVFYDKLASNEKYVAEAISHEAGHTVGLRHDGTSTAGYYSGQGSGATGWAPIMGVGYYKELVQWSKGEYADANNTEDDYLVMQSNSLYLDQDDYANSYSTATPVTTTTVNGYAQAAWQGVLQGPNDVDVVAFDAGAGTATIDATPFIRSPNVDLLLKLLDQNGNVLATANPVDALNASITYNLPSSGRYYISVDGTGKGDPLVDGYTDYGSIGIYNVKLQAQVAVIGPVPPKAIAQASVTSGTAPLPVDFSAAQSYDSNNDISSYSWNFGDGTTGSGVTVTHQYTQAGNFTATVTVTDATGLSDSASVNISVQQAQTSPETQVGNISMAGVVKQKGKGPTQYSADALVYVQDNNGACVPNALVTVNWGGMVSGTAQAYTTCTTTGGGGGKGGGKGGPKKISGLGAAFSSPSSKSPGTITIDVTNVDLSGYVFKPSANDQQSITVQ